MDNCNPLIYTVGNFESVRALDPELNLEESNRIELPERARLIRSLPGDLLAISGRSAPGQIYISKRNVHQHGENGVRSVLSNHQEEVTAMASVTRLAGTDPDHRSFIASGDANGSLVVTNVSTGSVAARFDAPLYIEEVGPVRAIASRAGSHDVYAAGDDPVVRQYDYNRGVEVAGLDRHRGAVVGIALDDRHRLISASVDGLVVLWDPRSGKRIAARQYGANIETILHSQSSDTLFIGTATGDVKAVRVGEGNLPFESAAFKPNGPGVRLREIVQISEETGKDRYPMYASIGDSPKVAMWSFTGSAIGKLRRRTVSTSGWSGSRDNIPSGICACGGDTSRVFKEIERVDEELQRAGFAKSVQSTQEDLSPRRTKPLFGCGGFAAVLLA